LRNVLTSRLRTQAELEIIESVSVYRVWSLRRSIHHCGLLGERRTQDLMPLMLAAAGRREKYGA
jgi:hypothetical protein